MASLIIKPDEYYNHTISFTMLSDLRPIEMECAGLKISEITIFIPDLTKEAIKDGVQQMITLCTALKFDFRTGYFINDPRRPWCTACVEKDPVALALYQNGFEVEKYYDKYYCYAWAIDYTRFEVASKGCEPEIIEWKGGSGRIKGPISNVENYFL